MKRGNPPRPGKEGPPELRPIGARALKSATDTLRPYLAGARVLDLYAGQGRFGFAALEEDAAAVVLVEKDPATARQLLRDATRFGNRCRVVRDEVSRYLSRPLEEPYDIVFADPPFPLWNDDFARSLFTAVRCVLADGAIFLVKTPTRVVPSVTVSGLLPWKNTVFGESELLYFTHGKGEQNP